jgi:hypothetical protein
VPVQAEESYEHLVSAQCRIGENRRRSQAVRLVTLWTLVDIPALDDVTATVEMSARTNGIASDHATFHGTAGSLVVDFNPYTTYGKPNPIVGVQAVRQNDDLVFDFTSASSCAP